jgi:hypothetical protein
VTANERERERERESLVCVCVVGVVTGASHLVHKLLEHSFEMKSPEVSRPGQTGFGRSVLDLALQSGTYNVRLQRLDPTVTIVFATSAQIPNAIANAHVESTVVVLEDLQMEASTG